jgi:hypothetical protein
MTPDDLLDSIRTAHNDRDELVVMLSPARALLVMAVHDNTIRTRPVRLAPLGNGAPPPFGEPGVDAWLASAGFIANRTERDQRLDARLVTLSAWAGPSEQGDLVADEVLFAAEQRDDAFTVADFITGGGYVVVGAGALEAARAWACVRRAAGELVHPRNHQTRQLMRRRARWGRALGKSTHIGAPPRLDVAPIAPPLTALMSRTSLGRLALGLLGALGPLSRTHR